MTEAEAKMKWCPFVVASHTDPRRIVEYSREELGLPPGTFTHPCIGSACMAWRWSRASSQSPSSVRYPSDPGAGADVHGFWYRDGEPLGFCGLAGRPE